MSTVPSCDCGETRGEFNLGVVCESCGTACASTVAKDLESILWMRAPNGVADLINPTIWYILNNYFKRSSFELVRWLADPTYRPQSKVPKELSVLQAKNYRRSYNSFVENFDDIMHTLFGIKSFNKDKARAAELIRLLKENRNKIFSKYIPLPNKSILIVEGNTTAKYVDPLIVGAINAIEIIASIDSTDNDLPDRSSMGMHGQYPVAQRTVDDLTQRVKENRAIKALCELSNFYPAYYGTALAKKAGLLRRQVYGCRSHFSLRAVISSITDAHDYEDIHLPWSLATGVFRIHLLNKLTKRGYMANAAVGLLNYAAQAYHPLISELFDELLAEAHGGKIPLLLQRNPSLERGSL